MTLLLALVSFLLVPSLAYAWGPLTHVFLGSEVLYLGSLLPPAVYSLIKRYRQDFLYGNLMADSILGKKYLPRERNSHNWDVAAALGESATTDSERAFVMGYMSHLAADTVAHGTYTAGMKNLGHTYLEIRADSIIGNEYWLQAMDIDKGVQERNDAFMEGSCDMLMFSFNTNKRIFKGMVVLSCLNGGGAVNPLGFGAEQGLEKEHLLMLHDESLDRMVDVLRNGNSSHVLKKDPISRCRRGRVMNSIFG